VDHEVDVQLPAGQNGPAVEPNHHGQGVAQLLRRLLRQRRSHSSRRCRRRRHRRRRQRSRQEPESPVEVNSRENEQISPHGSGARRRDGAVDDDADGRDRRRQRQVQHLRLLRSEVLGFEKIRRDFKQLKFLIHVSNLKLKNSKKLVMSNESSHP